MTDNYFDMRELTYSYQAEVYKINNEPPADIMLNLRELRETLNSIREFYGKPILISSGYRCPTLNRLVGGVYNSIHMLGYAADLIPADRNILELKRKVLLWADTHYFDQIIFEGSGIKQWVHFGLWSNEHYQRRMIIR